MYDYQSLPRILTDFASYKMTIQGRSEKTVYNYCLDLLSFFRYVYCNKNKSDNSAPIDAFKVFDVDFCKSITDSDIYSYLLHCASVNKNKPTARARKLSSIKSFFKYFTVNAKLGDINPAKDIETPKISKTLPKFLTISESRAFLDAIKEHGKENAVRDLAIYTLFLNCGMRLNELCSLSLSDLEKNLESVIITGKGSKQRMLYLNAACKKALSNYLEKRAGMECKDKNALWVSRNSQRLSDKTVQYNMKKYLLLAGLGHKQLSVHKLRHTAATLMYSTGKVDVRVLKDILGHEQLNTTQIYTHVSNEQVKKAMLLNPLSNDNNNDKE